MNEAVRNLALLVWALSAVNSNVHAQSVTSYTIEEEAAPSAPVVVFGSANLGKGKSDSVLMEQNNEDNPLGNPLNTDSAAPQTAAPQKPASAQAAAATPAAPNHIITENLPQNPQLSPTESPPQVNKQIQNTLYESGGRIYDIQSFPTQDIKTIEEPNLNPTITTYPAD